MVVVIVLRVCKVSKMFRKNIRSQVEKFVFEQRSSNPELSSAEVLERVLTMFEAVLPGRECTRRRYGGAATGGRCLARVWGGGVGGQCFKGKCSGSDYCKACGKKAEICDVPVSFTEEGKHLGLFWGRVDEERPMMSADGKGLAIMWRDEEGKKSAREILARDDVDGWHPFCTQPGCRTADWDAPLKTTVPRQKKGGSKKKKKGGKRIPTAKQRWMKTTRAEIQESIRALSVSTQKFPSSVVGFYIEAGFDVEAAAGTIKGMTETEWVDFCEENGPFVHEKYGVDEVANFSGELKGQMLLGPVGKAGAAMWKSLSEEEQEVFEEERLKEKAALESMESTDLSEEESTASGSDSDSDCTEEKPEKKSKATTTKAAKEKTKKEAKTKKKSKTKKKPVIKKPPTPSPVEEEVEEVEVSLGDEDIVHGIKTDDGLIDAYVDGDGTAFDMDGEELGEYNAETNEIE